MTRSEVLARPGRSALLGAAAAALLGLAPWDLTAGLAVLAVLTLPVAAVLGSQRGDPEPRFLQTVFLAAVGVRAVVAVVTHFGASAGFFALDDDHYSQVGWQLAQAWVGQGTHPVDLHGTAGYYRWNALVFTLVGHVPLAPAMANAAIGGWSVLLAHAVARDAAGPRAARGAALLAAFWPSLVLWSSLNLKDALAILAILLLLRGAQRLGDRWSLAGIVLLAVGFAVLCQLRGYLVWITAAALSLAWVLSRLRAAPLAMGAILLAAALLLPVVGPPRELVLEQNLESLDHARSQLATGGSAYHGDADVSTASGALRFLPLGLAYFLLAPAPWQLLNARQLLTLPEMLVWYALLPFIMRGIVSCLRVRFAASLPLAAFVLFTTLCYALVEGNLGTAYRHRAQVLVPLLIFASAGIAQPFAPRLVSRRGVAAARASP